MKIAEIMDLTTPELEEKLKTQIKLYEQMKMNHRTSPLDNPSLITESRRGIARMKTEIRQREINNCK